LENVNLVDQFLWR